MNFEGISYMLLKACQTTDQQFMKLTQPTGGHLPNTEPEYRALFGALRRLGHVIEHKQDNIASGLRGGKGPGKGHYWTQETSDSGENVSHSYPQWNAGEDTWNQGTWESSSSSWTPCADTTGWNLSEWPEQAYATQEHVDSGTDTDTVSSLGDTWYDMDDIPEGLTETEKAEELFLGLSEGQR